MGYFTIAELRALPDMGDTIAYPDATCALRQAEVEQNIERNVRTSFVSRSYTETYDGTGGPVLKLRKPYARTPITACSVDGVALTGGELADLIVHGSMLRRRASGSYRSLIAWNRGYQNIVVTYPAYYSAAPPADVKEAALIATRYRLITTANKTGASDRALSITNEFGNIRLSTAGLDYPFGLPEVDEVISGWARALKIPRVA